METAVHGAWLRRAGQTCKPLFRFVGHPAGALGLLVLGLSATLSSAPPPRIQFVYTSDAHYGLTRQMFRGHTGVSSHLVNAAMVSKINAVAAMTFPHDDGLAAGTAVGPIDFVVQGGDIANREEDAGGEAVQPAAASWAQFRDDYVNGVTLTTRSGDRAPVFILPGNHDASNAVGFYRPMTPPVDNTAMVGIFNLMMGPRVPVTNATYDYVRDAVRYSRDVGGVHFMFVGIWPDSAARRWMEEDLATVAPTVPAIIFAHDQPDAEAKHFRNPNGAHDVNAQDRFEDLLADELADGPTIDTPSSLEQAAFEQFLAAHPNVTAYFHGNSNWNEFYDWTGPFHRVRLHTFRVDSPTKGAQSTVDETRLSFQVVTINPRVRAMTVRECLWNADPQHPDVPSAWGASATVPLSERAIPGATETDAR